MRTVIMKAEQLSKNILSLESHIRFAGVIERSGHLYASARKEGLEEYLKGRDPEISLSQSAYIVDLRKMFTEVLGNLRSVVYVYDKVKLFSIPVKEHVLVISAEAQVNSDDLIKTVLTYVESVDKELSLFPPGNVVNAEKKEILRNLLDSGISEDLIAEQLDLDENTVKMLVAELK
jgi:hypothetical protein